MERSWPPRHRWEYSCTPKLSSLHKSFDLALHYPLMKWFVNGELSHAWHYRKRAMNDEIKNALIYVDGDPEATVSAKDLFGVARGHLGGWPHGRIIQPDFSKRGTLELGSAWHYAFYDGVGRDFEICTIDLRGPAIFKIGPESFYASLVDLRGHPIPTLISPEMVSVNDKTIIWPRI